MRRDGSALASAAIRSTKCAAGQRRNGLPALTWTTTIAIAGADAGARQPCVDRQRDAGSIRHLHGNADRSGGATPSGASRSH